MLIKGQKLLGEKFKKILVIQLGDIGDVVLSFPVVRALKENYPEAEIFMVVRTVAVELIEACPWAAGAIPVIGKKRRMVEEMVHQLRFFHNLRGHAFDLVVDLRTGTRGAIISFLSRAKKRVTIYDNTGNLWRNRIFTHLVSLEGEPAQHMCIYLLKILSSCGLRIGSQRPRFEVAEKKKSAAIEILKKEGVSLDRPIIAVQPFSLWSYKEWGVEKFSQLVRQIVFEYGFSVVVTGAPDERDRARQVVESDPGNAYNLAGKTTIGIMPALLNTCSLFIGGDSAGIHMAAAAGTPTVGIFGPASWEIWAPRGLRHRIVVNDKCRVPCSLKGCNGNGVSLCLEELTVEKVYSAVKQHIEAFVVDK
jgi:predicted lipopolysaccharide heptosyltransferase III